MSRGDRSGTAAKVALGLLMAGAVWWLVKRVWLAKEGTEAEPPASTSPPPPRRDPAGTSRLDPVDEAIAESFPASDPPSYAGARGAADL